MGGEVSVAVLSVAIRLDLAQFDRVMKDAFLIVWDMNYASLYDRATARVVTVRAV